MEDFSDDFCEVATLVSSEEDDAEDEEEEEEEEDSPMTWAMEEEEEGEATTTLLSKRTPFRGEDTVSTAKSMLSRSELLLSTVFLKTDFFGGTRAGFS